MIYAELERLGFPVPEESPAARVRRSLPPSHPWAKPKTTPAMQDNLIHSRMWNRTALNRLPITKTTEKENSTLFVISNFVAVHIRRGDYENHCQALSKLGIPFNSWDMLGTYSTKDPKPPYGLDPEIYPIDPRFINETFPALPDTLYSPPYSTSFPHDRHGRVNPADLSREQLYKLHCWPNLTAIINKLRDVKDLHPGLEEVYLMTNGTPDFVDGLKHLLYEGGWRRVRSSLDLKLTDTAVAVSQAVDMALATWAEVFVGNGVGLPYRNKLLCRKMNCHAAVFQSDFKYCRIPTRSRSQTKHNSLLLRGIFEYGMMRTITTGLPEVDRGGNYDGRRPV